MNKNEERYLDTDPDTEPVRSEPVSPVERHLNREQKARQLKKDYQSGKLKRPEELSAENAELRAENEKLRASDLRSQKGVK